MKVLDVTNDGRAELLVDGTTYSELVLLGPASEPRGDLNGDGVRAAADVDELADYLAGSGSGIAPGADVNGDARIGGEDVLALIDHVFAGGAAPQP